MTGLNHSERINALLWWGVFVGVGYGFGGSRTFVFSTV